jgi:hypothetical protein
MFISKVAITFINTYDNMGSRDSVLGIATGWMTEVSEFESW